MDLENMIINCPIDNTKNELSKKVICPDCREDLSSLGRLKEMPVAYYNQGLRLAKDGKLDLALQKLAVAAEMKKTYVEPLVIMGKIYAQKKIYTEAINCWQRVLAIDADNITAQKGIKKIEELLAKEKEEAHVETNGAGETKPESLYANQPHMVMAWLKFTAASAGIGGIFLLCSMFFFWHILKNQNHQIKVLESQIAGLHKRIIADFDSLVDTRITGLQGKINTDFDNFSKSIQDLASSIQNLSIVSTEPTSPAKINQDEYIIQKGDTLWAISERFLSSPYKWQQILKLNQDIHPVNPKKLPIGQKIKIPDRE